MIEEEKRLQESEKREKNWKRWGPYLSERQWATVREDYSRDGSCWNYFPHDHARSRAYRWGEDGLLGITDRECRLCFALALWNGKDPILKERLFGLVPTEGNHGEDVKEYYYYLDSTPTHAYMKALYKYPQERFPYEQLVEENKRRGLDQPEFELVDTGIFEDNKYFNVTAEYAKKGVDDLIIRVALENRSAQEAPLHFLPTLWFRNTWSWGYYFESYETKPSLTLVEKGRVEASHPTLGTFYFTFEGEEETLFTDNETNYRRLYGAKNETPYVKDAFHDYLLRGKKEAVNQELTGTKCSPCYVLKFSPGEVKTFIFRLHAKGESPLNSSPESILDQRKQEADAFYTEKIPSSFSAEEKNISRQAYAGLLWTKQFYCFIVKEWLHGDKAQPKPPVSRLSGRNHLWTHVFSRDVISMPDKWEYPWFAAWDLAFHMIPFSCIDPDFAKSQMILFLREWYMHPNGQQPAYEFEFSEVNPPVHAWAVWRIYKISGQRGERDRAFLESAFQKLLLNFTWWVNRKDRKGNNLFSGGFLGLDNIGIFDRSKISNSGGYLEQADGTAWMAFYCLTMLTIALELAEEYPVYEDMASKFFEHFVRIADAMNEFGGSGLWNEEDGFYYDLFNYNGKNLPIRVRSLVGLIPLLAVEILDESKIKMLRGFNKRMEWFLKHRDDLEESITYCKARREGDHRLLAIPSLDRLKKMLGYLLDEKEFLSPFGIRSLSKFHQENPYSLKIGGETHTVAYVPGESNTHLFGGNSNWRGPIWFPLNFLIIEALERYDHFYGEKLKVECPAGSGKSMTLKEVAEELSTRLCSLFLFDKEGCRPCFSPYSIYHEKQDWANLLLFHEYFHAETGAGLGASHQTGWTALITKILEDRKHDKK
ncbi:MAG: glucosidase [Waddliaceae bacterium]